MSLFFETKFVEANTDALKKKWKKSRYREISRRDVTLCPAEKNLHVWPTQWRDPMTRHSAAKKYSSRTVCQIDSNVHFADHRSHAITPQWCQYQTGSPHWQCVDRVEDKYTCILQQATCWQRPLLLCPQVDRSTAPLKSIPALRLVGGPANRSLVAASRLMKERLMSRKLDTGQETEKRPS